MSSVSPETACVGLSAGSLEEEQNGSKDPPLPGLPGGAGGGALDPVDCLGAGVGEFVGMIAEAFADGIPPNVAGDVLYLIGGPKNVIVVTRFPESVALGLAKLEGCALFEEADEFEQVAATVCTLDKNMKVVRHQTVGMQQVGVIGGAF